MPALGSESLNSTVFSSGHVISSTSVRDDDAKPSSSIIVSKVHLRLQN